jgi:hypothetical protein
MEKYADMTMEMRMSQSQVLRACHASGVHIRDMHNKGGIEL